MNFEAVDDKRVQELVKLGWDREAAESWLEQVDEDTADEDLPAVDAPLEVWPENWPALQLFLRLQTQWRRTPSGTLAGLRYGEAESAMRMLRLKDRATLFDHLVEMEHAVLEALSEQH